MRPTRSPMRRVAVVITAGTLVAGVLAGAPVHAAPAVVVMAAGTNDLQDVPAFRAQVVRARAMLPRSTRLLWVDVYVEISRKHYAANRAIRSVRGVEPLGWSRTNARSLRDGRSRLLSDGVHINARGCEMRNELIVAAVDGAARR